ncbi:hypothetical protein FRC17_008085 [Serendipita sp. 399]|nr:hypothetical protein FRC17_008085 [Serendipita sp. 399]
MEFLQTGCATMLEFDKVNQTRENLRLVCKRWNSILSTITTRLAVQMDPTSTSLPGYARDADRLHARLDNSCSCKLKSSQGWCTTRTRLILRQQAEENDTRCIEKGSRIQVLCINNNHPRWLEGFLESNPPLRALSVTYPLFVEDERLHASSLLGRITHLRLDHYGAMIDTMVQISLPDLLVLDYNVFLNIHHPSNFYGQAQIASWSMPKLKTLILRQVSLSGTIPPAYEEFILSHKTTLTELVIYCNSTDVVLRETNKLLELVPLLPNLEVFGMDAPALLRATPDLPMGPELELRRTLLLDRFQFNQSNTKMEDRIKKAFEALFVQKRLFKRVWLYSTWGELKSQLLGERKSVPINENMMTTFNTVLYRMFPSLQSARDLGITILDRQGVSLSDDEWRDWIRSVGVIEV